MLTPQLLENMDDGHAVAALRAEIDPLTSTWLEVFLLDWVESLLDDDEDAPLDAAIDASEIDRVEVTKIIEALAEFNIWKESDLRDKLDRADKFYSIAEESGDVISRLNDLINTTL